MAYLKGLHYGPLRNPLLTTRKSKSVYICIGGLADRESLEGQSVNFSLCC